MFPIVFSHLSLSGFPLLAQFLAMLLLSVACWLCVLAVVVVECGKVVGTRFRVEHDADWILILEWILLKKNKKCGRLGESTRRGRVVSQMKSSCCWALWVKLNRELLRIKLKLFSYTIKWMVGRLVGSDWTETERYWDRIDFIFGFNFPNFYNRFHPLGTTIYADRSFHTFFIPSC